MLQRDEDIPSDYMSISFVCLRHDGAYESAAAVSSVCRSMKKKVDRIGGFHFHALRHPYVKHTTKNKSLQKQKSQAITEAWDFCFYWRSI